MLEHKIFQYFEEISAIPRGSGNNKRISDYLVNFAATRQLAYEQDEHLNVIIVKEATPGYEELPGIILQGHMDMVCEKVSEECHDFLNDGIQLEHDEEYLFAKDTTLGGDDGIAVAYALAILDDDTLTHPRLEVIFTTDEEIGLLGATALDASRLQGKYMVNIDSEEEDSLLVSCAGGLTGIMEIPLEFERKEGRKLTVSIKGLTGGHSGMEIHKNRVNGHLLMGRLLYELGKHDFQIISVKGGTKDNAIPREAIAELAVSEDQVTPLINEIKFLAEKYKKEYRANEPELTVLTALGDVNSYTVMTKEVSDKLVYLLMLSPNGIQSMSANIPGLVESSLNMGILYTDEDICASFGVRSSISSSKNHMSDQLELLCTSLGGTYHIEGEYPGWEFKKESKLRELYSQVFKNYHGYEVRVEAIHAGLECGILAEKLGDIDIISIGPDMQYVHTVEERLSISSAVRVYDMLLELIRQFCEAMK